MSLFELKNPRLQMVFNVQTDELRTSFMDLKVNAEYSEFKHELLIAFWLSVELGCLE